MKRLIFSAVVAFAVALPFDSAPVFAAPAKKKVATVKWHSTYARALAEAKRTSKPIFVDVYTTWCGPCKYLDDVTFKNPKFVRESRNWVMVKLDPEKGSQNFKLATKLRVQVFPTMLFLKPNGKEAGRAVGGYPATLLVSAMRKAADKVSGGKRI